MSYKITEKVTTLVENLIKEGYDGEATLTNSYCTGTAGFLGDSLSVQLNGFCKETMQIVEDTETGEVVFVGRYDLELRHSDPTVETVVELAWNMYKDYKEYKNWSMPSEFKNLFLKYGYLTEKKITKTVLEERK